LRRSCARVIRPTKIGTVTSWPAGFVICQLITISRPRRSVVSGHVDDGSKHVSDAVAGSG
jgi:hypothetical protein